MESFDGYMEHHFKSKKRAFRKQSELKSKYGLRQSVFRLTHPRTQRQSYLIVEPLGLFRLDDYKTRKRKRRR